MTDASESFLLPVGLSCCLRPQMGLGAIACSVDIKIVFTKSIIHDRRKCAISSETSQKWWEEQTT